VSRSDQDMMRVAIGLAARGLGLTWPNPAVGCVIVAGGRVVGRGWTQPGGRPHAETMALAQAGDAARGATVYVTLEPCAHHGHTPPCAESLIAAGVARIVCALGDPDPRVNGQGFAMLRDAGIEVVEGVLTDEARVANAGFLSRIERGRPMMTLKLASSFDGRIATATGESQWITGPEARRVVHSMRATHDAVMVGGGTARADDPTLTVRGWDVARQPVRVVASRILDIPLMGKLAMTAQDVPLWLCHGADASEDLQAAWRGLGAVLLPCRVRNGQLDVVDMMGQLGANGMTRVFCEGGGALAASLLNADVVDDLVGFGAGITLGAEGRPSIGALVVDRLVDAPRFDLQSVRPVGADVMHHWRRAGA